MSYEGYSEFLCVKGHYQVLDVYGDTPEVCGHCKEPLAYSCAVDLTNGEDEEIPGSLPGDRREIGHEDDWRVDHHGNHYALRIPLYEPVGGRWHRLLQTAAMRRTG